MNRRAAVPVTTRFAASIGAMLLRTLRFREYGVEHPASCRDGYVLAVPHASLLCIAGHHRNRGLITMASRSGDGSFAAALLQRLGYAVVRGSTSTGGSAALRDMARRAEKQHAPRLLGLTVDGPRGPAWTVQPGVVALARLTGLPILPMVATCRGLTAKSWDRLRIPLPFARCRVFFSAPVSVDGGTPLENARERVERSLARLRVQAGI